MRRFEIQERLAVALRRDVDLVDLRAASTVMRMQVVAHGVVLAVFDVPEKERFEMYVYSSSHRYGDHRIGIFSRGYARLNEERQAIVEQVVRDGTVYGR